MQLMATRKVFSAAILVLGFASAAQAGPYAEVQKFMRDTAAAYPANAQLFTLGDSDAGPGIKIEGLRIGNGPVHDLIVATHHGNEYGSTEVAKGVATSLAQSPILGMTVFVIPVLNVDGYNRNRRQEMAGGRSFDPNRNYPGPCGTEGPFTLKSTAALAKFIADEGIVASATLHTFSPAVMYPWGISTHDLSTPYDDQFKSLVAAATVESRYATGNSTALLYPADGTFEDYAFWKHGIWSILYELGSSHSPSRGAIAEMVRVNVPGLRRQLEQSPRVRAENHGFAGRCDVAIKSMRPDRHDE